MGDEEETRGSPGQEGLSGFGTLGREEALASFPAPSQLPAEGSLEGETTQVSVKKLNSKTMPNFVRPSRQPPTTST